MPPKVKVLRERIIDAAIEIVRKSGAQAINARNVASLLNCSTQPVFSNFATMEELKVATVERAETICGEYIRQEVEAGKYPAYKASGMAYIRFAKEEKELFKLLYMRNRENEKATESDSLSNMMEDMVQKNTGLDNENVKLFHLEMWVYVHGIAVMAATDFIEFDTELVRRILTDAYQGLRKQYGLE